MIKKLKQLFHRLISKGKANISNTPDDKRVIKADMEHFAIFKEMQRSMLSENECIKQLFDGMQETKSVYDTSKLRVTKYFILSNRQRARDIYNYSKATNSPITNKENEKVTSANCYKYGKGSVAVVTYKFTDTKNFKIAEIVILPRDAM